MRRKEEILAKVMSKFSRAMCAAIEDLESDLIEVLQEKVETVDTDLSDEIFDNLMRMVPDNTDGAIDTIISMIEGMDK